MTELIHGHLAIGPPAGVEAWDIDPYASEVQVSNEAYHRELCSRGAFVFLPKYSMLACGQYDVVKEVFSDHERFVSSRGVGLQDFALEEPWRPPSIVLEVDPPAHTRTRRAIMRALSPRVVRDLRELFLADARALVSGVLGRQIDGVADLAEVYPTTVFPKAVGLRNSDARKLVDYGSMVFNALGPDNEQRRKAMANAPEIAPWIAKACLRENLEGGSIGASIYESADDGEITKDEAGMLVRSLLSAGVDTTVTAIGNALWALGENPTQFAALRADHGLAMAAFEETLRFTSPVEAFCRTAVEDTQVAGVSIAAGTKILCVLGAANRDPANWGDPDVFDITRKTMGHLALGVGVHVCVGQNIGRAEGQAVLTALAEQVERIELLGPAVWRPSNAIHGLESLPLKLVAAG